VWTSIKWGYTDSYVFVWFMLAYLAHMCLLFFIYSAGITEGFSMCAGDFVEVYSEESQECKITYFSYKWDIY
jgi:hypothetical protein